ncbi:hypothetical protein DBR42_27140, partial [Pelomonas sp. HMWF004]
MQIKPLVSLLAAAFAVPAALASANGVVISQVYGGNGNVFRSDYVELFNGGAAPVPLAGMSVQYASATGTGNFVATALTNVTLQPGQYYLVKLGPASTTAGAELITPDATGATDLSGTNGKVILARQATGIGCNGGSNACSDAQKALIVDLLGYGSANFFEGAASVAATSTTAMLRAANGCTDTDSNASDFARGTPAPRNSASPFNVCGGGGSNAPILPICPDGTATAGTASNFVVSATDSDSRVNAVSVVGSLPAGVTLDSFTAATGDGVAATQSFSVANTLAAGSYNLSLKWDNDEAQTASCTFKLSVSGVVAIPAIQGSGAKSPLDGTTVTTTGVVTKLINNGFFLQDPLGDNDAATSDGIFVFTSTAPTVAVGDSLRLTAKVAEFSVSTSAASQANPLTELTGPTGIVVLSSGNQLPQPVEVSLAALSSAAGMERFEGMLVRITDALTVNQTNFV